MSLRAVYDAAVGHGMTDGLSLRPPEQPKATPRTLSPSSTSKVAARSVLGCTLTSDHPSATNPRAFLSFESRAWLAASKASKARTTENNPRRPRSLAPAWSHGALESLSQAHQQEKITVRIRVLVGENVKCWLLSFFPRRVLLFVLCCVLFSSPFSRRLLSNSSLPDFLSMRHQILNTSAVCSVACFLSV